MLSSAMKNDKKKIAVYCASSTQIDDCYFQDAHRLGQLMAGQGITLVNGAGNMGLMAASADGCLENGGQAIGVIPTFMIGEGWCHNGMSEIIETVDMHERQQRIADMTDGGIFLPRSSCSIPMAITMLCLTRCTLPSRRTSCDLFTPISGVWRRRLSWH